MDEYSKNKNRALFKLNSGFTLIELMVVVLIIVILATLAMVSYTSIRVKSRDTKRVTSINTLQTALNAYYKDHGVFPSIITAGMPLRNSSNTKVYLDEIPFNPQPRTDHNCNNLEYIYKVSSDKQAYSLSACIGADNNTNSNKLIYGTKEGIFHCGDKITDRDGFTYGTVTIGSQCWMSENLKTKTRPDGSTMSTAYNGVVPPQRDCISTVNTQGIESDCVARGALYIWPSAVNNDIVLLDINAALAANGTQGICPDGWHIPTDQEWTTMEQFLTDPPVSTANCDPNRTIATPPSAACVSAGLKLLVGGSTGFNARLNGRRSRAGGPIVFTYPYGDYGITDFFVTSTCNSLPPPSIASQTFWRRNISADGAIWRTSNNYSLNRADSIRCIKD
jgi:uncharacterized protein (TIGR02145 family)/prepilin-type N-terminal cleavage/methylation domain-containing protein